MLADRWTMNSSSSMRSQVLIAVVAATIGALIFWLFTPGHTHTFTDSKLVGVMLSLEQSVADLSRNLSDNYEPVERQSPSPLADLVPAPSVGGQREPSGPSALEDVIAQLKVTIESLDSRLKETESALKGSLEVLDPTIGRTRRAFQDSVETHWDELEVLGLQLVQGGSTADLARASVAFMARADIIERFGRPTSWGGRRIEYSRGFGTAQQTWEFLFDEVGFLQSVTYRPSRGD